MDGVIHGDGLMREAMDVEEGEWRLCTAVRAAAAAVVVAKEKKRIGKKKKKKEKKRKSRHRKPCCCWQWLLKTQAVSASFGSPLSAIVGCELGAPAEDGAADVGSSPCKRRGGFKAVGKTMMMLLLLLLLQRSGWPIE